MIPATRLPGPRIAHWQLNHRSNFARGLVGLWIAGNRACWGSGLVENKSLYGNDGTFVDRSYISWTLRNNRPVLHFDADHGYIDCGNIKAFDTTKPFSISVVFGSGDYIYIPAAQCYVAICGIHNIYSYPSCGIDIYERGTGQTHLQAWMKTSAGSVTCWPIVDDDFCHQRLVHVVGTFTEDEVRLYLDGALLDSLNHAYGLPDTSGYSFYLRHETDEKVVKRETEIESVMLFSRRLSDDEVAELYETTRDGGYGDLLLPRRRWWPAVVARRTILHGRAVAGQVFTPGAVAARTYTPGAERGTVFVPGAVAGKTV